MTPAEIDALRRFAKWALDECRDGHDLDGVDVQEKGVELGLLVDAEVFEPC